MFQSPTVSCACVKGEVLETITAAITSFFAAQQGMLDQVPQLGHLPKVFKAMTSRNDAVPKTALQIVHQLANSEVNHVTKCCSSHLYRLSFLVNRWTLVQQPYTNTKILVSVGLHFLHQTCHGNPNLARIYPSFKLHNQIPLLTYFTLVGVVSSDVSRSSCTTCFMP